MQTPFKTMLLAAALALSGAARADIVVPMTLVDENGVGKAIGQITISETKYGIVLTPSLNSLGPGLHGFHIHENPNCSFAEKDGKNVPALAAGGHFDPKNAKKHGAPWGEGHLGDLPPLFVDNNGNATQPVSAPRLQLADLTGHSLMIHAGADNHSDQPAPLGGGGARLACGVIQ